MALSKVKGYVIALTVNDKTIVGTTSDTFSGGGVLKESIQKSNAGQTQYTNAGFEGSLSVSAFVHNGAAASGEMNIENLMDYAGKNTTGTFELAFGTETGDPLVTGTCTFMSCTVNSDSENYSDCTVDLQVTSTPNIGAV